MNLGETDFDSPAGEEYSPVALDHAQNPRWNGRLSHYHGRARLTGSCGESMEMFIFLRAGMVEYASFITDGCGASHACGSMTVCLARGKPLWEVLALEQQDIIEALEGLPAGHEHCAGLAVATLRAACEDGLHGGELRALESDIQDDEIE